MVKENSLSSRIFDIILVVFMVFILAITLMPVLHIVSMSFSASSAIERGLVSLWPVRFTVRAYEMVWKAGTVPNAFLNSVRYTLLGTIFQLFLTILMAYPLSKRDLPFRGFYMKLVIITMFFGGGLIPNFLLIRNLGLMNTMWALIIPSGVGSMNMIIMRTFFESHPKEMEESAFIDGANDIRILWSIILPLSKASLATIGLFYAVGHWNSWFSANIYLRDQTKYPLQLVLREIIMKNQVAKELQEADMMALVSVEDRISVESIQYAVLTISMAPLLMVYPFIQKYFVKGAMLGSIKG